MDATVEVLVNGEPVELPSGASVADLLRRLLAPDGPSRDRAEPPGGIAVAVGDDVVPAGQWASTTVRDGDRIEVLGAVAGG